MKGVYIPFWSVMLVIGVPTVVLLYRDRRYPPGRCQKCGYSLTGNVSGVCPECGRATGEATARRGQVRSAGGR